MVTGPEGVGVGGRSVREPGGDGEGVGEGLSARRVAMVMWSEGVGGWGGYDMIRRKPDGRSRSGDLPDWCIPVIVT